MAEEFDPTTGLESKQDAPKAIKAPKAITPPEPTKQTKATTTKKATDEHDPLEG